MDIKRYKDFEYVIQETRTYVVTASGRGKLDADQDAIARFHRLRKSGDLPAFEVSKPRIVKSTEL